MGEMRGVYGVVSFRMYGLVIDFLFCFYLSLGE